jgi:Uma2 family endonuclease
MPVLTDPMTYEELLTYPNDGKRREIHDGELIVSPSPDWYHQDLVTGLATEFRVWVRRNIPGGKVLVSPLDVRLTPHNVYQPDIVYVSPARLHILRATMPVEGAPDLVVEVLSPSTRTYDQREKARVYAQSGILEYWIVDPEARTVEVLALDDDRYVRIPQEEGRATSRVLAGFSVELAALFAGL